MERELRWDACWNVRDLGGYDTGSGVTTRWKSVVRAGNLSRLTAAGRDALIAYGIRTVIDLRDPREFAIDMNPFHERGVWAGQLSYVSEPLISDAEWEAIRDPAVQNRGYVVTLGLSKRNIGRVMSAIATAPLGGVVVHCHAGKERTGVIAALLLALAGVTDETIAADYVESDLHLASLYQEWAAREPDPEKRVRRLACFKSEPEHILEPLKYVRGAGGIEVYLLDAGLSPAEIDALSLRVMVAGSLKARPDGQ